jgi:hypothetical protein
MQHANNFNIFRINIAVQKYKNIYSKNMLLSLPKKILFFFLFMKKFMKILILFTFARVEKLKGRFI